MTQPMNPILARLAKAGKLPPEVAARSASPATPKAPAQDIFAASLDTPIGQTITSPKLSSSVDEALERAQLLCKELENALRFQLPNVDNYLTEMNLQLREYPELLQLLADEEIAAVYSALRNKTNVAISVAKSKTKKSAGLLDSGESVGSLL